MKYLITGGAGFIGSNLAEEVLKRGDELFVFDNLSRFGSSKNLELLKGIGEFKYFPYDIRNNNDVEIVIKDVKPDIIFHLAGQVAMTTSIANPRLDFEVNTLGTLNLLEAVRKYSSGSKILFSSTNKVYGDFANLTFDEQNTRYVCCEYPEGFGESVLLNFQSPYGCSKGAADQNLLDYYHIYGIETAVFRHSSMYGSNQHATIDQGWIGWFCQKAIEIKRGTLREPFSISGNGKQVRDVLHSDDIVKLYFTASENMEEIKGEVFNIGGGRKNSLSLLELFEILESELGIKMEYRQFAWRNSDQKVFIADNTKIISNLKWTPLVDTRTGIIDMLKWLES